MRTPEILKHNRNSMRPLLSTRVSRFNIDILYHDGCKIMSCRSGMIIILEILLTILPSYTFGIGEQEFRNFPDPPTRLLEQEFRNFHTSISFSVLL
jgi:hypothetical protein